MDDASELNAKNWVEPMIDIAAPPMTEAVEVAVATDAAVADPTEVDVDATMDEVTAIPTEAATAADIPCLPAV